MLSGRHLGKADFCVFAPSAEAAMSVSSHDVVFRHFKDFEPHAGTPIDIMHNMESGMMADLLEV